MGRVIGSWPLEMATLIALASDLMRLNRFSKALLVQSPPNFLEIAMMNQHGNRAVGRNVR